MIHLTIHPEGVAVVKGFGIAALVLACVALRFSSLPGTLFAALIDRVVRGFPPPSKIQPATPSKQILRHHNRRLRHLGVDGNNPDRRIVGR